MVEGTLRILSLKSPAPQLSFYHCLWKGITLLQYFSYFTPKKAAFSSSGTLASEHVKPPSDSRRTALCRVTGQVSCSAEPMLSCYLARETVSDHLPS